MTLDADVKGDAYEGLLAEERRGRQGRRGPVLHAAPADPGDRGRDAPTAPTCRSATRRAARVASSWPPTSTSKPRPRLDPDEKRFLRIEALHGLGDRRCDRPAVRHEPAPARDRAPGSPTA